jgi:hypothetical protein
MASIVSPELVFVVDVTSFTTSGFMAKTTFEGDEIAIQFDQEDEGVFLLTKMAKKIAARKGAEDGTTKIVQTRLAGVGDSIRISDAEVYYAVGREGGVVIRVRKPS